MGLLLGCKDVTEFVDKGVEEALKKEKERKNENNEGQRLNMTYVP